MQVIPLFQAPAQTVDVLLDGQHCSIFLYWRQERLYMDMLVDQDLLFQGAICQNRADIVQLRSRDFTGTLHFFDMEGDRPPHWQGLRREGFGRWALVYVSADEELPQKLKH